MKLWIKNRTTTALYHHRRSSVFIITATFQPLYTRKHLTLWTGIVGGTGRHPPTETIDTTGLHMIAKCRYILSFCHNAVSYTHLTLPTNREV